MNEATFCISRSKSFEVEGRSGEFCTYHPKDQTETILSVQEDGSLGIRPKSQAGGAWETWKPSKDGLRAVFYASADVRAIPLVD